MSKGFEKLLAGELEGLRIKVRPLADKLRFTVLLPMLLSLSLVSPHVSRHFGVIVLAPQLGPFSTKTSPALLWEDHIGPHVTIAVSAHGTNDQLRNTNFIAVRSKDAIVDRLAASAEAVLWSTLAPDVILSCASHATAPQLALTLLVKRSLSAVWRSGAGT